MSLVDVKRDTQAEAAVACALYGAADQVRAKHPEWANAIDGVARALLRPVDVAPEQAEAVDALSGQLSELAGGLLSLFALDPADPRAMRALSLAVKVDLPGFDLGAVAWGIDAHAVIATVLRGHVDARRGQP